jgi:hypothetical protein
VVGNIGVIMDVVLLILQIITLVALAIAAFIFRNYLPSYLKKKGENLATKEDIEDITNRIERVRTQYSAQLEEIRASIGTTFDQRRAFTSLQQNELLKFYDIAVELFYEKLAVNFADFPSDKGESLFRYQESFQRLISSLLRSYQRIVLYFEHEDQLRVHSENVLMQALEARLVLKRHFGKVKFTFLEEQTALSSDDREWIDKAVRASDEANKIFWDTMEPVIEKFRDALRLYLTVLNKYLRPNELPVVPELLFKKEKQTP